jgi:hypothetical protein
MKREILIAAVFVLTATLACGTAAPATSTVTGAAATAFPTPEHSVFDDGRTAYGFFPSPPEITLQSVMDTIIGIGEHGDVLLIQRNIPWSDFVKSPDADSQDITDIRNLMTLARQSNLDAVYVIDPLNGLNRREFYGLPFGWNASFANPDVRAAFTNYTLRILHEFHPRYLGLASEINTYADSQPDDFPNYLSLYREVYAKVKTESPETKVFVTFQWEEMNNLMPQIANGRKPYSVNWDQMEAFEPQLDLWVISSYPFVVFKASADIPKDYYTVLNTRTEKPLAVAEGGFTSQNVGPFHGTPEDQVAYLDAIHDQIGGRLTFWIYLLYIDFNLDSYARMMRQNGHWGDVNTLGLFASVGLRQADGTPKPALDVWDGLRKRP